MLQSCQCSVGQATDGDRSNDVFLNSTLHPSLLVPEHEHAPATHRKGRTTRKSVCPACNWRTPEGSVGEEQGQHKIACCTQGDLMDKQPGLATSAVSASGTTASGSITPYPRQKKDADYVFFELTRSICPECRRVIDAHILLRHNKVYMRKRYPEHGLFEGLVYA